MFCKPLYDCSSISLQIPDGEGMTLDILVENAGRVNFGSPLENRKGMYIIVLPVVIYITCIGINGKVVVDGAEHLKWKIYSLEFKSNFVEK